MAVNFKSFEKCIFLQKLPFQKVVKILHTHGDMNLSSSEGNGEDDLVNNQVSDFYRLVLQKV